MDIKKTVNGNEAVFEVSGWLDTKTSPQFGEAMGELGDEITKLTLDLKDLEYISSAGLREILAAHKAMQKKEGLVIRNVCTEVMDVFRITGFDQHLTIQ